MRYYSNNIPEIPHGELEGAEGASICGEGMSPIFADWNCFAGADAPAAPYSSFSLLRRKQDQAFSTRRSVMKIWNPLQSGPRRRSSLEMMADPHRSTSVAQVGSG